MSKVSVRYLKDVHPDVTFRRRPVKLSGPYALRPGQGADGYGRRIASDIEACIAGKWRRVYTACFSNVPSSYIEEGDDWLFVRDSDLPEGL